jgi:antitoxin component YwqK of YwqJK toxin-antitoxin module
MTVKYFFSTKFLFFLGFYFLSFNGDCQKIIEENYLTKKDSFYYYNSNIYNGDVAVILKNGQIKRRYSVINGIAQGTFCEYFQDSNFDRNIFLDTSKIRFLEEKINLKKQKISSFLKDTLVNRNKINKYIEDEIGGLKKLEKLKEKSQDGDLSKKRQFKLDSLNFYDSIQKQFLEDLFLTQKEEKILQNQRLEELNKPKYNPAIELSFEHYNYIKNGLYKRYFKNEKLESEGSYLNNTKNGEWKEYDSNTGRILLIENYKGNLKDGNFKKFVGDIVIEEGVYKNDLMNGEWTFRDINGNLKGKGSFINGNGTDLGKTGIPKNGRDGQWILYNANGKIEDEINYIKGVINGQRKSYFENGLLSQELNYSEGLLNGSYKKYHPNGKLEVEGTYFNNKLDGLVKKYNENGILIFEGNHLNGKLEGLYKTYFDNGILSSEQLMKQDERNGLTKIYHPNGKLSIEGNYLDGKAEGLFKVYQENGVISSEENYKNGDIFKQKLYHPNGKLKQDCTYLNNELDGLAKLYNENGFLTDEINYTKDKKNGLAKSYFPNGKLKIEGNFLDGKAEGLFKVYQENGVISSEENYKNGELIGTSSNTGKSVLEESRFNKPFNCECCGNVIKGIRYAWGKDCGKASEDLFNPALYGYFDRSPLSFSSWYLYCGVNCVKNCSSVAPTLGSPCD